MSECAMSVRVVVLAVTQLGPYKRCCDWKVLIPDAYATATIGPSVANGGPSPRP